MNTATLALRYLWSRPLTALLNLLLLTLGLAAITFVVLVGEQAGRAFERDLAGIDLVVGAKGSPLQLILAGVFQIDVPPGNVPLAEVRALQKHPQVARLIPLSMGDSLRGHRIVGTTPDYLAHYGLSLARGQGGFGPMEALLGAGVARATGLAPGEAFVGNHGLGGGGHAHGDTPYRVAGVLAPCGCVADRLVLTSLESVWRVHEDATTADEEDRRLLQAEREVTLALIAYRTPLAAVSFPRMVNATTAMQAAAPAVEVTRLARMLGVGGDVLRGLGLVLLATAALSVFIALWNAVRERRADLAMLRMLGATPARVAALVVCEALWLALIACVLGLAAGHALAALVGYVLAAQQSLPLSGAVWLARELWIPAAALAVAVVAALIPALSAYRVDVARLLQSR
ncbi:FtsX-like permease family protein [Ramlibacter tataouinensis]|uniref:Candidate ABC transporter, permease component n=1 Tax=Ramlibacter tataouinensis (strain ATCC BAA-407 / DSM 14655 / LMG 21543 / TTB310) TaxID=365046 RepID=F5Y0X5_RAMTT|nr:FtsX-like permease family protein [Ramlibacter tataouinensis]AEG92193.1 candidate ABC transporter, permease component [Ramlibacter tataouinensis TTB310]